MSKFDPQMSQYHPLKILLADDNAINQQVAAAILAKFGYSVDLAFTGSEVIKALGKATYDVIFMDIKMPEMNGVETTQHIRQHASEDSQPYIIAMTGNVLPEDRDYYLSQGMNDYLKKPINIEDMIQTLLNAANHTESA